MTNDAAMSEARIDLPTERALALFRHEAAAHDLRFRETASGGVLETEYGEIELVAHRRGPRVILRARHPAWLQVLRETLDAELGVGRHAWSGAEEGALPANLSRARVAASERISPSYRRVRLEGPDLGRFARDGLHFRLLLPPSGRAAVWPRLDATGRTRWPTGADALHRPAYTVRAIDASAGWLDLDVVLHAGGRASAWAETVRPGAEVAIIGPGGGWAPRTGWVALLGDATALPAIARILHLLPRETRGETHIRVPARADVQTLGGPGGVAVHWWDDGDPLLAPLGALRVPGADRFVWVAAEAGEVAEARRVLGETHGLTRGEMQAAAYWRA